MADHALIVGASRGVGAGLAAEFGRRRWTVTATTRRPGATVEGAARVETVDIDDADAVAGLHAHLA